MEEHGATGDIDPRARRTIGVPASGGAPVPATIGRFRTLRVIGQGGMGVVYLAEQDNPRRQVALKVIRPGMASAGLLRRFEFEAQVLGRLGHPGIAQIYDAGTADTGAGPQPYFAMELVEGSPLTEYVRAKRLGTRERLRLMAQVCEAVQHAHSKGVIHRDLKPGNILVTPEGQPKILDFGVARATDSDVQATTLQTDVGQLVGTLPYMSPEQVAGDPGALDVRSDVYALGVVLYEVLAERPPYRVEHRSLLDAARTIREEEPTRLSVVSRVFRGDVETIVSKALEKDRARRYQTAAELGDDIRRYLSDEPITARPPSAAYQVAKFARRHKGIVAGLVVAFVAMGAALVVVSGALAQAVDARAREGEQRRQAEAARSRAEGLLTLAMEERDRSEALNRTLSHQNELAKASVEQLLVAAGAFEGASGEPGTTSEGRIEGPDGRSVRFRMARQADGGVDVSYEALNAPGETAEGLIIEILGASAAEATRSWREASRLAEERLAVAEAAVAEAHAQRRVVAAVNDFLNRDLLSSVAPEEQGIDARVRDVLDAASMRLDAASGPGGSLEDSPEVQAELRTTLGVTYRRLGVRDEAERHLRRALDLRRAIDGPASARTISALDDLAGAALDRGDMEEAERLNLQALGAAEAHLDEADPARLLVLHNRASVLLTAGRLDEARPVLDAVLEGRRTALGHEHPDTLASIQSLAYWHERRGQYERSEELGVLLVEAFGRARGEEHPDTLMVVNNLATLYDNLGRSREAEPLLRRVAEVRARVLGPDHPHTLVSLSNLAYCLDVQDRDDEAEVIYREVLAARRTRFGPEHPQTLLSMNNLASLLDENGRGDEAEPILKEVMETRLRTLGTDHPDTIIAVNNLAVRFLRQGRHDEAIDGFTRAREASIRTLGEDDPGTINATNNLAFTLLRAGRAHESEALFRAAVESGMRVLPSNHWFLGVLMGSHGAALAALDRREEAERTLLRGYEIASAVLGTDHGRCQTIAAHLMRLYRAMHEASPSPDAAEKVDHWRNLAGSQGED